MKALVTGGGGFLGSYIVELLLQRKDEVFVVGRGRYPYVENLGARTIQTDIRDLNAISKALEGMDVVYHTAAKPDPWGKWEDFYSINVEGTKNIIEACKKNKIRYLVYTSSPSVIFADKDMENVDESVPYPSRYLAYYPHTKAIAEKMVLDANGDDLKTTSLRPHLIFGPRDNHLIPRIIARARQGRIVQVGNGKNKIDVVYVVNAARAHLLAADALMSPECKPGGKAYFITQGEPVFLWDFVNKILKAMNLPVIKRKVPYSLAYCIAGTCESLFKIFGITKKEPFLTRFLAAELAKSHCFNITRAREDFGYIPEISTEEGFQKMIEYFKSIKQ